MRQNSAVVTRQNLVTSLQATHPSNILAGLWLVKAFTESEFHGGTDPGEGQGHPLYETAAMLWAELYSGSGHDVESLNADFDSVLTRYTKVLTDFSAYLSTQRLIEAQTEVTRIQAGLLLPRCATLETAPAKGAGWRESLACAVALAGAVLLGYTCNGKETWQCFVSLLSLLLVAVPVWRLATWYGQRRALVQITQPTR
ncbi:MAG: hypothetical protein LAO76_26305 [Acidobacteriia bacterium]|nr:hypothetical protein [Terriglobia bacterium]